MKNLISILICLFIISVATSMAQYSGRFQFTAAMGLDVNQTPPKFPNTDPSASAGPQCFNGSITSAVSVNATAVVSATKYRGDGAFYAQIQAGLWTLASPVCRDLYAYVYRDQPGSATARDSRVGVSAAFLENGSVQAGTTSKYGIEGSAYAQLTITW
jgi:hypothetical protein